MPIALSASCALGRRPASPIFRQSENGDKKSRGEMRNKFATCRRTILAIIVTVGPVSTAIAQQNDSTRRATKTSPNSAGRIPIKKESGGEVALPPVNRDSVAAAARAHVDSLVAAALRAYRDSIARVEQMRRDSIATAERRRRDSIAAADAKARRDSIARADSIAAAHRALRAWMWNHGGWYYGIGAGASIPS